MCENYLEISRNLNLVLVVRRITLFLQTEDTLKACLKRLKCEFVCVNAVMYFVNFVQVIDVF